MSKHLERQIDLLKQKVLFVGSLVEEAIAKAVSALVNRDPELARAIVQADMEIDRMEVDVEEECLKILALYQPVAADLRFVVAVLKINNDLERMGDLAENIAKKVLFLADRDPVRLTLDFRTMTAKAQAMVKQALDALVARDAMLARAVRDADQEVDDLNRQIRKQIEAALRELPDRADCLLRYISVTRHIERLADMAVNVAEEVIYMVEGDIVRHKGSA
ncbi:MAG TPA: phosphate signaling complex protein PhoU [Pirellulales bacterium]|jgi:phosphate transport system protein|nr:phosphate signaling complex protein PhoU [Pirellulales bacterium]